ncbi:hypothetical protein IPP75_03375 [Candidatus Saccharibacteria bacterium]|nr:MAG: hypothetical protein IPP75_03375 [Candidatus Saccharibacteria bacterium]
MHKNAITKRRVIILLILAILITYPIGYITGKNTGRRLEREAAASTQIKNQPAMPVANNTPQVSLQQSGVSRPVGGAPTSQTSNVAPNNALTPQVISPLQYSCDETAKATYQSRYDSDYASEVSRHQTEVQRIADYWAARNAYNSSWRENEETAENQKFASNVSQLQSTLRYQLVSIHCA